MICLDHWLECFIYMFSLSVRVVKVGFSNWLSKVEMVREVTLVMIAN